MRNMFTHIFHLFFSIGFYQFYHLNEYIYITYIFLLSVTHQHLIYIRSY
nr:MAG TPA: hypothetical protein [Caudoviricetes sp.]